MFRSFAVKNFRCFQDLTISSLERVNLIGGKNNVGKTALLEALFLHLGANNAQLPLVLNARRGMEGISIDPREVWGWLFYDKQIERRIELTSRDRCDLTRTLMIRLREPRDTTQASAPAGLTGATGEDGRSLQAAGLWTTAMAARVLEMIYEDSAGRKGAASASLVPGEKGLDLRLSREETDPFPLAVSIPSHGRSQREDVIVFSKMVEAARDEELLEALRIVEPRLKRLMVLVASGVPVIHGDVGSGPPVPLPLMGEGAERLLSLLLAIAGVPGGIVMVDEVENGLHHSVLVDLWRTIGEAARRSDTQIFATTHSWECIVAAERAYSSGGEVADFRYQRLERGDRGARVVAYVDDLLGVAIETGLEVR